MTPEETTEAVGPYLLVACLCETVVQRADQVLTLVNIIDRLIITSQGPSAPETMPPQPWQTNLVLVLKAGRARGRFDLRIVPELPDGSAGDPSLMSVNFEGEDDRGIQIVTRLVIGLTLEGLHWFKVYLGGVLITKLPLRVVYSRIVTTGPAGLGPGRP